jgi:hypothetical protein
MVDHEAMRKAYLRAINEYTEEPSSEEVFKKPYRGKFRKKFFSPFSISTFSLFFKKLFRKDRLTVVLKSDTTSKKIEVIKFTSEETDTIMSAASTMGVTLEQFFKHLFEEIVKDAERKTNLRELS